jgi:hypothetical protein
VVLESSGRLTGEKTAPSGNRITLSRLSSLEATNHTDYAVPASGLRVISVMVL